MSTYYEEMKREHWFTDSDGFKQEDTDKIAEVACAEVDRLRAANAKLEQELKDARKQIALQAANTRLLIAEQKKVEDHFNEQLAMSNRAADACRLDASRNGERAAAAESRLAALERDGERLDWLENQGPNEIWFPITRAAIDAAQQADAATGKTEGGK